MKLNRKVVGLLLIILLVVSAAAAVISGSAASALRSVGLLPPIELEATFINVGFLGADVQGVVGDAILLRSSEGKQVLIDGGYKNGLALDYLLAHNIDHLDMVIMSHPHDDHAGGLIEVLNTIPVDRFVSNGEAFDSPVYEELVETIRSRGVRTQVVKSGDRLAFGSLTFQVISPNKINPDSVNNNSVVLRLVNDRVSFLFTGDTQHLEEERLLAAGVTLKSDIYKVPHHGADTSTSSAFIIEVAPSVAIYSAGAGNMHHLPQAKTLENLNAVGAEIYGTDINGTIIVTTDGKTFDVIPERNDPQ